MLKREWKLGDLLHTHNHRWHMASNLGWGASKPWLLGTVIYEGVQLERCGKILTLQNKINRIMVVAKPRTSCRSMLRNQRFYLFHANVFFHLWPWLWIIRKISKNIVLIQGLSTIFVDQLSACHVFRKVHSVLASKFSIFYHIVLLVLEMKRHNFT